MQALATSGEEVPDGAILAQPVLDTHGQLLLPAGANVTRDTLKSLRQRGIETVMVDVPDEASAPVEKLPPQVLQAQVEKRLRHLFRPALQAGQLNPIFHLITEYRLKEGS